MIEFSNLDTDEETETVENQFARLRVGPRKFDGVIVAAVSVWRFGVCVGEIVDFVSDAGTCQFIDIVWARMRDGFRIANHNESVDWKSEQVRHG